MARLKAVRVSLKLPYIGGVEGTWEPDKNERLAAWETYVELATRISTAELRRDEGLLREALLSHYSLFTETRSILRKYGPGIAKPRRSGRLSYGYLAVVILNTVIRPLLAKWHPLLSDHEAHRNPAVSPVEHERAWERQDELRAELAKTRSVLIEYADLLAQAAGVPSLIVERPD